MIGAIKKVREFHDACDVPICDKPRLPSKLRRDLRQALLGEEYLEYRKSEERNDIIGIADALGDMVVIIIGTSLEYGIDLDAVFSEIHKSNMTKIDNGQVIRREDGKILKPYTYKAPDLKSVLGLK